MYGKPSRESVIRWARSRSGIGSLQPGRRQLSPASRRCDRRIQLCFVVGDLRSGEQELQARLSTDADTHRLLLQERHAANRQLPNCLVGVSGHRIVGCCECVVESRNTHRATRRDWRFQRLDIAATDAKVLKRLLISGSFWAKPGCCGCPAWQSCHWFLLCVAV